MVEVEGLHHVVRFEFDDDSGQDVIRLLDDWTSAVVDEMPLPAGLTEVLVRGAGLDDRFRVDGLPPAGSSSTCMERRGTTS